ncbi:MAG: aldose epimerase family protein [Capnocytophaga sp.]|nr:aldose epimerase family protein [Capnocytophaga sp.]
MSYITQKLWGKIENKEVFLFTLTNKNGMQVSISNFGGIIQSVQVPSLGGEVECVLGFNTLEEYLSKEYRENYPYFGAIIGRNAGRIKGGKCPLNGKDLQLTINHNGTQLHGGVQGFDSKVWEVVAVEDKENPSVKLRYFSVDGEEGFPGNLTTLVTYTLTQENELRVDYEAQTDKPTIVNLTQHSYFNFNKNSYNMLNHYLQINGDKYVPLHPDYSPTGEILDVEGTYLDYRKPNVVHQDIDNAFPRQVSENDVVGSLFCKETNIRMEVKTSHPVLHIYAGYYVPEFSSKERTKTGQNAGICFEAQGYADALNYPQFVSTQLNPEEKYQFFTIFKFTF